MSLNTFMIFGFGLLAITSITIQPIFLLFLATRKKAEPPLDRKTYEYVFYFVNKDKVKNTKQLSQKQILLIKVTFSFLYLILIFAFVLSGFFMFASIGTWFPIAKQDALFTAFLLFDSIYFVSPMLFIFRKICQVWIGDNRTKKKSDWLFFFKF
ncbi:hypothetical protein [Mycoplasma procyoni]|uniref:hypothetical protein n=1 Tax=Mycoplasma procyoni TaxID=568784 RepID=UPI00197B2291|nr:hypothetical protein [Mycoplasma procyoni]MBN3534450.1 hypothetical protein [Mycoplasma procyoni]